MPRPPFARYAHDMHLTRRLTLAVGLLAPGAAVAQGRSAAVLLELPASTRAAAMGDAGGALRDVGGLAYNPALVAAIPRVAGMLAVERYLGGSTLAAATAAVRLGPGVVGAIVQTLAYPDADEIVESPDGGAGLETGGRLDARDVVAGVSYAARRGRLHGGATAKWVGQQLPGASGGTAAADLGIAVDLGGAVGGALTLTGAAQHLGGPIEILGREAPLPRTMRVGASLTDKRLVGARWAVSLEATQVRGGRVRARQGFEGAWQARGTAIVARLGSLSAAGAERQHPLSVGGGIARGALALDYAWRRFGDLGSTHRFGVRWQP